MYRFLCSNTECNAYHKASINYGAEVQKAMPDFQFLIIFCTIIADVRNV